MEDFLQLTEDDNTIRVLYGLPVKWKFGQVKSFIGTHAETDDKGSPGK